MFLITIVQRESLKMIPPEKSDIKCCCRSLDLHIIWVREEDACYGSSWLDFPELHEPGPHGATAADVSLIKY